MTLRGKVARDVRTVLLSKHRRGALEARRVLLEARRAAIKAEAARRCLLAYEAAYWEEVHALLYRVYEQMISG